MNRFLSWISIFILMILTACNLPVGGLQQPEAAGTATLSPQQVQTQISEMLTQMPTSTGDAQQATATQSLPTIQVETATTAPTDAKPVLPAATDTPAPQPTVEAQATATPMPTATATSAPPATATQPPSPAFTAPPGDPRARLGAPASTDPMDDADNWVWPTGSDQYTSASFSGGVQSITSLDELDGWRLANPLGRDFTNLYLEATFRTGTCAGSDHYGIIVRVPVIREPEQGYLFGVTCDGRYSLRRWNGLVGEKGEMKWLVNWTQSSAISTGSNQVNRLGMFTSGSRLILYANGVLLTEVQDSTYPRGYFGVFVGADLTPGLVIQVDEMSYWENPQP